MYYPPLFTSVRPFDPRANPLGGPLEVPVVGTNRENPLDLSVKTIRQTPDSTAEADDILMLDHRKLASLAATHSLTAMGRQLGPGATLLDPSLWNPCSHAAAMIPQPFCFDRATGVAVPTSLAGHSLMTSYLQQQQQQRDRCIEQQQQQALFAARTTAQQAAAAAAVFMDQASLPLHLRGSLSQREAAAALAATRGLYAPALPTPMMLPAFSLYTEDKGAFTSLRNAGHDKSYLNGTTASAALEAARFAEHLQRLREQHLQQAGKCNNACCTSSPLSGLGQPTVPCACCIQSPSQAALCARSPMGCMKDPTTAATGKVCNTACDYLQPGLTFLHRPTAATAAPSDLRLPVPSFCATSLTSTGVTTACPTIFQPAVSWSSGLPTANAGGKTAFSVPKKKDFVKDPSNHKDAKTICNSKDYSNEKDSRNLLSDKYTRDLLKNQASVKVEGGRKEEKDVIVLNEENAVPYHRRDTVHDIKSLTTPKTTSLLSKVSPQAHAQSGVALTTVTNVMPIVPTKCEGGTIPITKMPPLLEAVRPAEPQIPHCSEPFTDVPVSVSSPQGPPPLIAVANGGTIPNSKINHNVFNYPDPASLRLPVSMYPSIIPPGYKSHSSEKSSSSESKQQSKSPKKSQSKVNGLPASYIKEEPTSKPNASLLSLPKPIPQMPSPHHLPSAHFASHYRPSNHTLNMQHHSSWIPPAHPNVTVAPAPQLPLPVAVTTTITTTTATTNHSQIKPELLSMIKREPGYVDSVNVLQSLLIRPGPGLQQPTVVTPNGIPSAPTVVMPNIGAIPGMDYHHHMNFISNAANLVGVKDSSSPAVATTAPVDHKQEVKVESGSGPDSSAKMSRKRPNGHVNGPTKLDDKVAEKKRILNMDYAPTSGYTFQHAPFSSEIAQVPECPYTFVPELPGSQVLEAKELRPLKLKNTVTNVQETRSVIEIDIKPKFQDITRQLQDEKSSTSYEEQQIKNAKRLAAVKAKRKLRKRLLARLYQKKRPLGMGTSDRTTVEKEIALQHTRRLLSQISSTWRHRRLLYNCRVVRKRKIKSGLDLAQRRTKKHRRLVYKIRREDLLKEIKHATSETDYSAPKTTSDQSGAMSIPSEMKRLMVNKALGETILHRAARLGYPEVVAYCLETTCGNVNARDNAGYTPLHECCSRGHLDIARALLQYGADVNASAAGGIRPLHDAVENDHVEVVRLLLSFGADPSIATYSGLVPLKLARSPLMAEFLQGFMADISGEIDNRPHLPWRFWGSSCRLDPEDNGYDVFDGVPSDDGDEEQGEGDDFLFEVSDSPHLPTFRLPLPHANSKAQCNYLRLSDVLRKTSMSKDYFLENCSHIEVLTLPRHEFEASATCSQLLTGSKLDTLFAAPTYPNILDRGHTVDLVKLDNNIRKVLGIETISVR